MATRLPYLKLYVGDFFADPLVEAMGEHQGSYALLLFRAWQEDPPASIPDDDVVLARWTRLSLKRWIEKAKPVVMKPWRLGADGRWHQKRLGVEYQKALEEHTRRSEAGRKGGRKPGLSPAEGELKQPEPEPEPEPEPLPPKPPSGGRGRLRVTARQQAIDAAIQRGLAGATP
jgi:uncharacterized protein YdaU (DUF1376 family)